VQTLFSKYQPQSLRADPVVYLTDDAPVDKILDWLAIIEPDEEINFVTFDTEMGTQIHFDQVFWAAITYASWSQYVAMVR
jgi:hypothetical protein